MKAVMKKPSVTILVVLLAVLVVLVTGCGSEVAPTAVTPSSPAEKMGTSVRLVFTVQPGVAMAGSAFDPQPVVAVEDDKGNIVTSYRGLVVLKLTAGTGASEAHLFGGTALGLVNGKVEFRGLYIDKVGTGYTLTATCGTLAPAVSKPFPIVTGAPAKLAFIKQPAGDVAGAPLTTQPQVTVLDHYENPVTSYNGSVNVAITFGSGPRVAVLSGTTIVPVVNGVARFTDLSIDKAYNAYTLTATSASLEFATSLPFIIVHTVPAKLEFTVQLSGAKAGKPFEEQPKVAVEDIYGNVATSSRASITLSLIPGTGTAGAVLSGKKTLVAEDAMGGLAEFTDLSIDRAGSGYVLTATSTGLTSATSEAFVVSP